MSLYEGTVKSLLTASPIIMGFIDFVMFSGVDTLLELNRRLPRYLYAKSTELAAAAECIGFQSSRILIFLSSSMNSISMLHIFIWSQLI